MTNEHVYVGVLINKDISSVLFSSSFWTNRCGLNNILCRFPGILTLPMRYSLYAITFYVLLLHLQLPAALFLLATSALRPWDPPQPLSAGSPGRTGLLSWAPALEPQLLFHPVWNDMWKVKIKFTAPKLQNQVLKVHFKHCTSVFTTTNTCNTVAVLSFSHLSVTSFEYKCNPCKGSFYF